MRRHKKEQKQLELDKEAERARAMGEIHAAALERTRWGVAQDALSFRPVELKGVQFQLVKERLIERVFF